ncbi:hypothetical protein [Demequina sp.]|uniref:hypothetical protein n=1 Tax=Demequina sp. TaxID=2050685 RepID=UPI003D10CE0B
MARIRTTKAVSVDEWPAELEDRYSPHWVTDRALAAWAEHAQVLASKSRSGGPLARWACAIEGWLRTCHPDPRWPAHMDFRWLTQSDLYRFYNAAHRGAILESLGLDTEGAINYFLNERG